MIETGEAVRPMLEGIIRVLLWGALLLFVVPRIVLGRERDSMQSTLPQQAARLVLVLVALVHVLSLLDLFDGVSLIGSLVLVGVGMARAAKPERAGVLLRHRVQIWAYDILDGGLRELRRLRDAGLVRVRRYFGERAGTWAQRALEHAPFGLILVALMLWRYWMYFDYPYPDSARAAENVLRLKRLGAGEVLAGGYYPLGTHAFALAIHTLSRVDQVFLWGVLGASWSMFTTSCVYVMSLRLRRDRSRNGGAMLAAAMCAFATSGALMPVETASTLHAYSFAAPFFLMLVASLSSPSESAWPNRTSLALLVLLASIHPVGLLVGLAALVAAVTGELAFRKGNLRTIARCIAYAAVATSVPLLWGALAAVTGVGVAAGALSVVDETVGTGAAQASAVWHAPLLISAGALSVAALFHARKSRAANPTALRLDVPSLVFLFCWALFSLPKFELPFLSIEGTVALIVPIAALSVGVGFDVVYGVLGDRLRRSFSFLAHRTLRQLPGIAAVAAILVVAPPAFRVADARMEPQDVLDVVYDIKDEFVAGEWSVVAHPELSMHVEGEGWSIPRASFLDRYDVDNYKWDPRRSQDTVPTPHLFFFVEKEPPNVRYRTVREFEMRGQHNADLEKWCRNYLKTNSNMTVFHESDELLVFHLHRTPDEERRVMARVWEAQREDIEAE